MCNCMQRQVIGQLAAQLLLIAATAGVAKPWGRPWHSYGKKAH